MVNLLAGTRCTAKVPTAAAAAAVANRAVMRLSPASAVVSVLGQPAILAEAEDCVLVPLGPAMYDQPRHVLVLAARDSPPLASAVVTIEGLPVAACAPASAPAAADAAADFDVQVDRTVALCALQLQEQKLAMMAPADEVAARLAREGARIGDITVSLVWNDESVTAAAPRNPPPPPLPPASDRPECRSPSPSTGITDSAMP